jgi:adenylate kinase
LTCQQFGATHVSTGDMLRQAMADGSPLGRQAQQYVDRGALVPDELILVMVEARLGQPDCVRGFLLDGFPRTVAQAEGLDRLLRSRGEPLDAVVLLQVAEDEIVRRLSGRRSCPACHASYHVVSRPPRVAERCDRCAVELVQRPDDQPDTIRARLQVYRDRTAALIAYYQAQDLVRTVDGSGTIDEIQRAIRSAVRG